MRHLRFCIFSVFVYTCFLCGCGELTLWQEFSAYPQARKGTTVELYHEAEIADPYRWLEDAESAETLEWVTVQNELTREYLDSVGEREKIEDRLADLWNYERYSTPFKRGDRYFFWKNDGLQNQAVLYVQDDLGGKARVVINPNLLSEDGTAAVMTTAVSEDGKLLAHGVSLSGSDEQEVRIRNVDTGEDYDEVLRWCRFTHIAWKQDQSGFFYNRFPDPQTVEPEDAMNYNRVYRHELGTEQSEDVLVYERSDNKELGFAPMVTEDGEYLVLDVYHGTDTRNRIYYRELESDGPFVKLLDEADAKYSFVGNVGTEFYFNTDLDAAHGRLIAIDVNKPKREEWRTIVAESDDVMDRVRLVGGKLVVVYMRDVHHEIKVFSLDGELLRDLRLPTLGTVGGLSGRQADTEMFFSFTSFLSPQTSYRYDLATSRKNVVRQPEIDFDSSQYMTQQVFCTSKDGTRIPMFITHKKGVTLDGENPTMLYGYGGFDISLRPSFSAPTIVWLEMGGVYVQANLRGGGEYGDAWHKAGMLANKQNVFDDFIAAAEYLIDRKYTSSEKLAIRGGSNGGLLVAACMLQRPDLYGAVVCQVPVIDMLRYHKFTVGRYWAPEYGNAEASKEQFDFLYAYSPLHNIGEGVEYPPILITSADTDDRVVPSHAKKFAATLQEKAARSNPILLRVETKAGHGGGKPMTKVIEERADMYAFLWKALKMSEGQDR